MGTLCRLAVALQTLPFSEFERGGRSHDAVSSHKPCPVLVSTDNSVVIPFFMRTPSLIHGLVMVCSACALGSAHTERVAAPAQSIPFMAFSPSVVTRWDERFLYVESDGLPHSAHTERDAYVFSHPMMVGITAWQQQVPIPQRYTGTNAWQIPLNPEWSETPISAKEHLFRGAIALAVNGVPIFNPIKNDGKTDTFLAGELDMHGGHCGRGDDYHYHIAPLHLQATVGAGKPIAYALDGYAIYGLFDPKAKAGMAKACPLGGHEQLDSLNGHFGAPPAGAPKESKGEYHYHASTKYPYLNGGMRGKVTVQEDGIQPQPRDQPIRESLPPLRGAIITGFKSTVTDGEPTFSVELTIGGRKASVIYRRVGSGAEAKYEFVFVAPDGSRRTETYAASRNKNGGQRGNRTADQRPPMSSSPK